ncbi:LLM class F420-dependent oxidoreductase [Actinophytocola xinjiangensis]|uniref:LLM class F420-dependent oxidoreductase n=1 Tax=Actinophytocola xinjiangensis TaxID=485602 RepID=A0A7Z0WIB5_9PSEU|nr:LLM class F420-dependent oxidoreductase [Actinophytocola xinjiangensis]OLF07987.1 LLM class F420-dependent oxidoreductase [Actinophytocola xinjiangensis]
MELSVVAASREDGQPPEEALRCAALADRLGYREVWLGEGPTWDAFVLATAVGLGTSRVALTAGPVPVSVRDPATLVRGAAGVEGVVGRPVGVALGTSSVRVVEGVHGRPRARPVADLRAAARAYTAHRRGEWFGATDTHGFTPRLPPATGPLTVAAFGTRAVDVAARYADRMLLDVVSVDQVRELRATLDLAAARHRRPAPRLAAWLPAAVDPDDASLDQLRRSVVGYFPVQGYREVFLGAGFGAAIGLFDAGAPRDEVLAALPDDAATTVGLVGSADTVRARLATYAEAGLDEVALVPATAGDPAGERTLTALA